MVIDLRLAGAAYPYRDPSTGQVLLRAKFPETGLVWIIERPSGGGWPAGYWHGGSPITGRVRHTGELVWLWAIPHDHGFYLTRADPSIEL